MPFTPLHFGPALFFGIPLRGYIHAPTFIIANVILDVEPLLVLLTGANYPLHGYLHTFIAAIAIGVLVAFAMFIIEGKTLSLYKTLLFETDKTLGKSNFVVAGVLGTSLHVLFDAPLYGDIKPLYPLAGNPLLGLVSSSGIYLASLWMGIIGIAFLLLLLVLKVHSVRGKAKHYASH